jgi:hypothetical protein
MWIVLFGAPLAVLVTLGDNAGGTTFGGTPVCLFAAFMLFCVILRRALRSFGNATIINDGLGLQPAAFL